MAFRAPALHEEIDEELYESQINVNFGKISTSFYKIQNELAALSGSAGGMSSNLGWVDRNLKPDGPIGSNSFIPVFSADTDGNYSVTLEHETPGGIGYLILDGVLHYSTIEPTLTITPPSAADGTFRYIIGANTQGAPSLQMVCEHAEGDTDYPGTTDIEIWEFDFVRGTDGDRVENLRRVTPAHLNADAWQQNEEQRVPLSMQFRGSLPNSAGDLGIGVLIPFDCEVLGAQAFLRVYPLTGEALQVELLRQRWSDTGDGTVDAGNGDNISVVNDDFYFTVDVTDLPLDTVVGESQKVNPIAPGVQLAEGDFVNAKIVLADGASTAEDLIIQLWVRPLRHEILNEQF